ncbi:methyltransferase domain protein [Synechococcus sp. SYN20]|uniref:methyltransferase domain-containing protein n=1 Tax=Synechococcus sp. SYN20 TaxID=1050714 RepID=UPI0016456628|nr:methyltransferase domain-containing protein [Synechococcus sp. SYN20]QNJ25438.1 methyltransferase domain protein [Synechococcus sp. SYN20]
MSSCCGPTPSSLDPSSLDQTQAVEDRYGAAAAEQEACLCTPVAFDPSLLKPIPQDVVDRDYGCGDPTRWVRSGDAVLDLGSGSGKNAFICAQVVGATGQVIGVDRNADMLALSRSAAPVVAERIGYANVGFLEGAIEALDATNAQGEPLVADSSIDVVLSNCVLNLVNPSARQQLLQNIRRVLRPAGRVAISDIVCDRSVPMALQQDAELWSGCISGAWLEEAFLEDFRALGFEQVQYAERSETPWRVVEGIEFRAVTLTGALPNG